VNRFAGSSLIVFGCLWGAWYFGMDRIGWGEPGSPAYHRYELYDRLLPLVLVPLAAALFSSRRALPASFAPAGRRGILLACAALLVMTLGSVLEFWLFTLAPYAPGSISFSCSWELRSWVWHSAGRRICGPQQRSWCCGFRVPR